MRNALKRHTLEVNDNGFLPEGSALEDYEASRAVVQADCDRSAVFQLVDMAQLVQFILIDLAIEPEELNDLMPVVQRIAGLSGAGG